VTAFEYRHATWEQVCELGPQGWRLVAIPPIVEMRQTALGQVQGGEPQYVMERQAGVTVSGHVHPLGALAVQPAGPKVRLSQQEDGQ
jgi:hypothetical protein